MLRLRIALATGLVAVAAIAAVTVAARPWQAEAEPPTVTASDAPWGRDYFPNIALVTHEGRSVRFFDDLVRGKVLAINFIYAGCTDSCPLETARLLEVQRILGERMGRDVFFVSITIDPLNDTPAALGDYAARYGIGPGWTLATGVEADITRLRRKLGLYDDDDGDDLNDHATSLLIGNQATGRWMKRSPYENPHILATQLGSWLHNWSEAEEGNGYADAPELRALARGEQLFRTRCAACHTIGAGTAAGMPRVGPDLAGVTRLRARDWLARWIAEPDRMLAEGDPLATALLAQYNNVPMPNLRLTATQVEALLDYLARADEPLRTARE